jgi:hypothetical protein
VHFHFVQHALRPADACVLRWLAHRRRAPGAAARAAPMAARGLALTRGPLPRTPQRSSGRKATRWPRR